MDHAEGKYTSFMVASCGDLFDGYGHSRPGVWLGDDQPQAEGVSSQGGRGDALLRRMPQNLTWPSVIDHSSYAHFASLLWISFTFVITYCINFISPSSAMGGKASCCSYGGGKAKRRFSECLVFRWPLLSVNMSVCLSVCLSVRLSVWLWTWYLVESVDRFGPNLPPLISCSIT